jgi:hypothetical protein
MVGLAVGSRRSTRSALAKRWAVRVLGDRSSISTLGRPFVSSENAWPIRFATIALFVALLNQGTILAGATLANETLPQTEHQPLQAGPLNHRAQRPNEPNPTASASDRDLGASGVVAPRHRSSNPALRLLPPNSTSAGWVNVTPFIRVQPAPRFDAYTSYDTSANEVLISGGYSAADSAVLNDTWAFHNGSWQNLTATSDPPQRLSGLMVDDTHDGITLVFGGTPVSGNNDTNTTWSFEEGIWTNVTSTTTGAPPPTDSSISEIVYNVADDEVVLLERPSQFATGGGSIQTWTYANATWSNITTTAGTPPNGTVDGSLTYDSADGYVVQFGGENSTNQSTLTPEIGTWTFSAGKWSELPTAGAHPSPRLFDDLVYDPMVGDVVLFGGQTGPLLLNATNDTWYFLGGAWTNMTTRLVRAPVAAFQSYMVLDAADAYLLYLGLGYGTANETWLFGIPPPLVMIHAEAGPIEVNQSYRLSVTSAGGAAPLRFLYPTLPPGCTSLNSPMIVCETTQAGVYDANVTVVDSMNRSAFASTSVTIGPGFRLQNFNISPDSLDAGGFATFSVILSGGLSPYQVSYSGLPPGCPNQNSTEFSCRLFVPGHYSVTINASDAHGFGSSAESTLNVDAQPLITGFTPSQMIVEIGDRVTFMATVSGGVPPLVYSYAGLPPGCKSLSTPTLMCAPDAPGSYSVNLTVNDDGNAIAGPLSTTLHVRQDLTLTSLAISPRSASVGSLVSVNLTLVGGVAPYTVSWMGLPSGCNGLGLTFTCAPNAPGTFRLVASVTDGDGHSANRSSTLTLTIGPATSSSYPLNGWILAGLATSAVVLGVIAFALRRRKKTRGSSSQASEPPPYEPA